MDIFHKLPTIKSRLAASKFSRPYRLARSFLTKRKREAALYTEIRASGYFDTSWYQHVYASEIKYPADLLSDYVRAGISQGRDPSPYFNTILYLREEHVPREQALVHFLRSGREAASGAYRSERVLLAAQGAYRSRTRTSLIADHRGISKPFAVYVQSGEDSLWGARQLEKDLPWDLLINHYDPTHTRKIPCDVEFHQVGDLPGTKFTSFYQILKNSPQILEPYEYILLLDDDILIEPGDLTRLFDTVRQHGWELAQPSLSADSQCSYQVFHNPGKGGWRQVNGVEIMMPVISNRILADVKDLFAQSISGWGIDPALSMVAARCGYQAVVLDDIIASHTKPSNADTGGYYQMLHQAGIYPEIEYSHLQKKYGYNKPLFYELTPAM
ncbi:MAG: DUF707 domain-containing protein [Anaerolineaceae bacterium]|nr:DUF707 domain-containing protein [Anaerolineaceae bacterium]